MPIRFEQPQPFLPYAAAGSAAVEEQRRQHQQQMQDAHFQQQQFEYFNRPNQIAQVQAQAYQQRLDFERQHIQQDFTMADQLELQRMTNGRAAVDKQLREGSIDEDTANGYYQSLEVPIGVLQQRRAYNQTKQEEEQTKRLMDQNARMKKMEEMDLNVSASNPQAVQPHYLPGQSPQDIGDDGEPLAARAVPVGFVTHEIDASGRTKRTFHPYKPPPSSKETQYGPPKQEFDEDGNPLPGLHQRGPDGRLHLVPTAKPEKPVKPEVFDVKKEMAQAEAEARAMNPAWAADHAAAKADPEFGVKVTDAFLRRHANHVIRSQGPGAEAQGVAAPAARKTVEDEMDAIQEATADSDRDVFQAAHLLKTASLRYGNIAFVPAELKDAVQAAYEKVKKYRSK